MKYLSFLFLFISCQTNSNNHQTTHPVNAPDTVAKIKHGTSDSTSKKALQLFNNKQPFEIFSIVDTFNMHTTDTDASKCGSWKLDKVAIKKIILHAETIDGTTWDLAFSVLKCSKLVYVKQHGLPYTIEINAGAYFTVDNADTTVRFGDFNKADLKYFLEGPNGD